MNITKNRLPKRPYARRLAVSAVTAAVVTSTLYAGPAVAVERASEPDAQTAQALTSSVDADGVFDGGRARGAGVGAAEVEQFATGWVIAGRRVRNAPVDRQVVEAVQRSSVTVQACSGRNRWDYTGIQLNVHLNSCNAAKLVGAIAVGAGVVTGVAIITAATGLGGAAAGAIAAGLTVAGGILTICSANGRGVAIHNIPPASVVWCNNQ